MGLFQHRCPQHGKGFILASLPPRKGTVAQVLAFTLPKVQKLKGQAIRAGLLYLGGTPQMSFGLALGFPLQPQKGIDSKEKIGGAGANGRDKGEKGERRNLSDLPFPVLRMEFLALPKCAAPFSLDNIFPGFDPPRASSRLPILEGPRSVSEVRFPTRRRCGGTGRTQSSRL